MQDENNPQDETVNSEEDLMQKIQDAQADDAAQNAADDAQIQGEDEVAELKNQLARAMADLQNYKRRSEEEKAAFVKYANAEMLKNLLPILDHLNLSALHLPEEMKENEWAKGVLQINADLLKILEAMGVKKLETVGQKLDPNFHEAVMQGPGEKDVIIEEFEPGYALNDTVVKPAKVKVGNGETE